MKPHRIHALTGIRAIAVVMVFLYHNRKYWRADIPSWMLRILNEFHIGVAIFFVLSGFLIAYTYQDCPLSSRKEFAKYLLIRLVRIFPVYLLILTIKYLDEGFPSTKETWMTYTLFHGFSDRNNLDGLPQAWSLTVELSFYTIAPIIYFGVKRSIVKTALALLLLLGITIGAGYLWHTINGNPDRFFYPWFFVLNTTFSGRFVEFFMGMLLAHLLQRDQPLQFATSRYKTITGVLAVSLVIAVLGWLEPNIYQHGTDTITGMIVRNVALPAAVVILLYGLVTERSWLQAFLGTRVLVLLGNASFVFYLIHIGYVNQKFRAWHLFPDRNFILLWLVSILVFLLVEKPVYESLKKLIRKWN